MTEKPTSRYRCHFRALSFRAKRGIQCFEIKLLAEDQEQASIILRTGSSLHEPEIELLYINSKYHRINSVFTFCLDTKSNKKIKT
jgi:hypothetical protein